MTKVTFSLQGDKILSVDILDHAGYAEEGKDIACAAISSAAMLTTVLLDDIQGIPVVTEENEPETRIRIELPAEYVERGQEGMLALRHYFKVLEKEYFPDFINVMEVQTDAED